MSEHVQAQVDAGAEEPGQGLGWLWAMVVGAAMLGLCAGVVGVTDQMANGKSQMADQNSVTASLRHSVTSSCEVNP
ncbi:MAG: hypothetical protein RIS45_388 [Planctomycetota bacterium]|jgi:hypothetical protein